MIFLNDNTGFFRRFYFRKKLRLPQRSGLAESGK